MEDRYDKDGKPLELSGIEYHGNRLSEWFRNRDEKRKYGRCPRIDRWITRGNK